jgi:hypothetical protein
VLSNEEELREQARQRAGAKLGFYIHFSVYVVVNIILVFVWWFTKNIPVYNSSTGTYATYSFPWFIFPLVGWGIGVLGHYLAVFVRTGITDKMTEKEYQRLKEKQQ